MLPSKNITILVMFGLFVGNYLVDAKPTIDYCQTCRSVSDFIHEMEVNQTESIVKMNIYKMCLHDSGGKNTRVCTFIATAIQNTLQQIGNEDFCDKINACPTKKTFVRPVSINEERCTFCTDLLDSYKSIIAESNIELIKTGLNDYCKLTGDFEDECSKNMNKNLVNFIEFIQNKMNSDDFCHAINSCHYQTLGDATSIGDLMTLRDPNQMASHFELLDKQDNLGNPLTCMVCRQVVVIIYSSLHKNSTREHVEDLLAKTCKTLYLRNKEKEKQCEENFKKKADVILKGFIDHIPPDLVCLLTGMCLPGVDNEKQTKVQTLQPVPDLVKEGHPLESKAEMSQNFKCYFCEKVVGFLFHELNEEKTREYIKTLLDKSCGKLFRKEERASKCEEYVNAYTDKLIDLIEKADNPGLVCNALHMCPINKSVVEAWDVKKLNADFSYKPNSNDLKIEGKFKVDYCSVCKTVYPILHNAFQIDEVKDKFGGLSNEFCNAHILPIKDCETKMRNIIDTVSQVEDANTGCDRLELCPNAKEKTTISLDFVPVSNKPNDEVKPDGWFDDMKCEGCKLVVKSLYINLNRTIHSPNTKKLIDQTCDHIKDESIKNKCKNDAFHALESLIADLEKNMPPQQACELMTYCKHKQNTLPLSSNKETFCEACHKIFPRVHDMLQDKYAREQFKNVAHKVCEHSSEIEKCKLEMDKIIEDFAKSQDADSGCRYICDNQKLSVLINLKMSECTSCQATMVGLKEIFNMERVRSKINSTLENFCDNHIKKEKSSDCKSMVKKNLSKFYEMIRNVTDHDNGFCKKMGYCQNNTLALANNFFNKNDVEDLLKGTDDLLPNDEDDLIDPLDFETKNSVCDNCKKFFERINQRIIEKESFKDELLEKLLKTCPQHDDKCRQFYRKYVNYFYDMLLRNTDPDRACPNLHLCAGLLPIEEPEYEFEPSLNLTEGTVCKECRTAITYLVETLNNKTVVDFVMKEINDKVCQPLNFVERKACKTMVSKFGPKIMKHFVEKIDQKKICNQHLKLCKDDEFIEMVEEENLIDFEMVNFSEDPNCLLCTRSVDRLNDLTDGDNKKNVTIEKICGEDTECKSFLVDFKDFFLNNDYNTDSLIACAELDFCLVPGRVQLLGGKKCNFGPAYSCLSSAHAKACKSTKFCQQNYWRAVENK